MLIRIQSRWLSWPLHPLICFLLEICLHDVSLMRPSFVVLHQKVITYYPYISQKALHITHWHKGPLKHQGYHICKYENPRFHIERHEGLCVHPTQHLYEAYYTQGILHRFPGGYRKAESVLCSELWFYTFVRITTNIGFLGNGWP